MLLHHSVNSCLVSLLQFWALLVPGDQALGLALRGLLLGPLVDGLGVSGFQAFPLSLGVPYSSWRVLVGWDPTLLLWVCLSLAGYRSKHDACVKSFGQLTLIQILYKLSIKPQLSQSDRMHFTYI